MPPAIKQSKSTTARPPSNLTSIGITSAFFTSCLFSILAAAEAIAALLASHWFDYANQSANSFDLWQSCSGSNCTDLTFTDVNIGLCILSGQELQGRFFSLRGLLIAGAVFSVFFALFIIVGRCLDSLTTHIAGVISSVLSVFCFASVIALFYNTAESFMFCGYTPCEYYAKINPSSTGKCYYMYGGPYGLVWTCVAAAFLAATISIFALLRMRSPDRLPKIHGLVAPTSRPGDSIKINTSEKKQQEQDDNNNKDHLSTNRRSHQDKTASAAQQQQRQMPSGLEEWRMNCQDFDFDEETNLYYSGEAQVYWDRSSNQFFDPSRRLWWDPVERRWKNDA